MRSFPGDMRGCEEPSTDADLAHAVLLPGALPEVMFT
jgi:hypothetical protein